MADEDFRNQNKYIAKADRCTRVRFLMNFNETNVSKYHKMRLFCIS